MAYAREIWKNREVERPRTFEKIDNPDGTITLVPAEGKIIEPGTPIIAQKMNNIEDGIEELFQSGLDGKNLLEASVKSKGGTVSKQGEVATFNELDIGIKSIETDKTGDATATAADILAPKDAYVKGQKIKGTIPSKGAATITPTTSPQTIAANQYLSGVQTIAGVSVPTANVLAGITIAGAVGTMPNRGAYNQTVTTQGGKITIPAGYHNGAGGITASFANLVAGNVKKGVNIGGVVGALIEGKQFATGTTASYYEGASVHNVLVNTLSFRPSMIYLWGNVVDYHFMVIHDVYTGTYRTIVIMGSIPLGSSTGLSHKHAPVTSFTSSRITLANNGFTFAVGPFVGPTEGKTGTFKWVAVS